MTDNKSNDKANINDPPKYTYTVSEIASILQIGKSKAYELCQEELFHIIKIGRAVRVQKASFDNWFNNQIN